MNSIRIFSMVFFICILSLAAGSVNAQSGFQYQDDMQCGPVGTPITFTIEWDCVHPDPHATAYWDFGSGANPEKATTAGNYMGGIVDYFSQDVTYSTPGDKAVTVTFVKAAGDSSTTILPLHIYGYDNPSIAPDAIVVNSDTILYHPEQTKSYWVNSGVKLDVRGQNCTIFAETGSTISGGINCLLYMKHGSVFTSSGGRNKVIFAYGVSIKAASNDFTLNYPALTFDYTNAPPNKAVTGGVQENNTVASIILSPNPTSGIVNIGNAPLNLLNVSVVNILGAMQTEIAKPNASNFQIDLTTLPSGTYYVRFVMPGAVVTKKIIRE
jgi:hypothetical protein